MAALTHLETNVGAWPFSGRDDLFAARAALEGAQLVTKSRTLRARHPASVWQAAPTRTYRASRSAVGPFLPGTKTPILDRLLAVPFTLLGALALAGGVLLLWRGIAVRFRGRLVEAEVVHRDVYEVPLAEKRSPGSLGGATVRPHLRYRSADGREMTAQLAHQTRQRLRSEGYRLRYPLGAKVRVRIDPRRPDVAWEDGIGGLLVFPALLVLAGLLLTFLALGIALGAPQP